MFKNRMVRPAVIVAFILTVASAHAQGVPINGIYEIVSGRYTACCGIVGPWITSLPHPEQAFVELTVDPGSGLAQMTILGEDLQTVLQIPAEGPRPGFTFRLTNGIVLADHIQFGDPGPPPPGPSQPWYGYAVSNLTGALRINGIVITPCPGCADFFTEFTHSEVVAVPMPAATIRVSEVEVCWNTVSNRTYQLQFQSAVTSNAWTNLGVPILGNGATSCVADKVPPGEPRRFYRVLTLP